MPFLGSSEEMREAIAELERIIAEEGMKYLRDPLCPDCGTPLNLDTDLALCQDCKRLTEKLLRRK